MTPSTAVKAMDEAMSSASASITGATAAIAELPQIELPQAISSDMRQGKRNRRPMAKLAAIATATTATMPAEERPARGPRPPGR